MEHRHRHHHVLEPELGVKARQLLEDAVEAQRGKPGEAALSP